MVWNPMHPTPETSLYRNVFVDLLIKAERSGALFRIPDCLINNGEWWSLFHKYPLRDVGWHPVAWMPIPEIPSEDDLPRFFPLEGDPV
jgi:hypothetical protein